MSIDSSDKISSRQIIGLTIVIVLSFVVPLSIFYTTSRAAFGGKPKWAIDHEMHLYLYGWGSINDGELWYSACHTENDAFSGPFTLSIRRLNLQTGESAPSVHNTGGTISAPCWINDQLYLLTRGSVTRVVGESLEAPIPLPNQTASFYSFPFIYEDQLTAIGTSNNGGVCLFHLVGDQWIEGPTIRLPMSELNWSEDSNTGATSFVASTTPASPSGPSIRLHSLFVRPFAGKYYLFATASGYQQRYWLHRCGFEFEAAKADIPSALVPENEQEYNGWERFPQEYEKENLSSFSVDQHGLLATLFSRDRPARLVRQQADQRWKVINTDDLEFFSSLAVVNDVTNGATYLFDSHSETSFAKIYRVEGDSVRPTPLVIRATMDRYLARWKILTTGALLAWFLHQFIVVTGFELLRDRTRSASFEAGIHRVSLAGIGQRALAFLTDAFVCVVLLILAAMVVGWTMRIGWKDTDTLNLCLSLLSSEQLVVGWRPSGLGYPDGTPTNKSFIERCGEQLDNRLDLMALASGTLMLMAILKAFIEGCWGTTPGKWLWGIKTMRTTLRPCGFAQSLLRNLMYIVDLTCFITPIPALLSSVISPIRQRLGDRFSDTVVIETNSIEFVHALKS